MLFTNYDNDASRVRTGRGLAIKEGGAPRAVEDAEVLATVCHLIAKALGICVEEIYCDSALLALGAQSFDFVDLVLNLEQTYGIQMPRSYAVPNNYSIEAYVAAVTLQLREETSDDAL